MWLYGCQNSSLPDDTLVLPPGQKCNIWLLVLVDLVKHVNVFMCSISMDIGHVSLSLRILHLTVSLLSSCQSGISTIANQFSERRTLVLAVSSRTAFQIATFA